MIFGKEISIMKVNFKKYIFKISLLLVLLVSAFTCVYAVQHYQSSSNMTKNIQFNIGQNMTGNINKPNNKLPMENPQNNTNNNQSKSNQANRNSDVMRSGGGSGADNNQNQPPEQNVDDQQGKISSGKTKGNRQPAQFGGNMQKGSENIKYFSVLSTYGVIFILLFSGVYYLIKRKKLEINLKDEKLLIFTLLSVGFLLRIAASTIMDGYIGDISLFRNWAETAANGLSNFYSSARQADYPPLYIYVLGVIGKIASIDSLNSYYVLMLKIPSILADVVSSYFIYNLGKKYLSSIVGIFLGAFYLFNPAIFIDSVFWGQVDSFFTLLILLSLYILCEKRYALSAGMFAAAILMKPQGIIFLPILFIELVKKKDIKSFVYSAISALIMVLIVIIPFSLNNANPLWIVSLYTKTISEYPYASVNAFNFFSLIGGNYKNYNSQLFIFNYHTIGLIFIAITTLIGWFVCIKGNHRKYIPAVALLQIAGVFTFSVGMHERYLFPAVALAVLAFIYMKDKRFFILAIGFSITSYINIASVLFSLNTSSFNIFLKVTSLLNVLLVVYLLKVLFDGVLKKVS